jgi:hypothetical protein
MPSEIERKLALLTLLASRRGRGMTQSGIFKKLPSFYSSEGRKYLSAKKMFDRDKGDLASMGFPLFAEPSDDGGETYRLEPDEGGLPSGFVLTREEAEFLQKVLVLPLYRDQLPIPSRQALLWDTRKVSISHWVARRNLAGLRSFPWPPPSAYGCPRSGRPLGA